MPARFLSRRTLTKKILAESLLPLDEEGRVLQKRFQQSYRERETGTAILEHGFGGNSSLPKAEAQAQDEEEVTVRATLESGTYRWFQKLWLTVELTLAPGLQVYGQPIPEGYIPLSVDAAPIDGLEVGARLPKFTLPDQHGRPVRTQTSHAPYSDQALSTKNKPGCCGRLCMANDPATTREDIYGATNLQTESVHSVRAARRFRRDS